MLFFDVFCVGIKGHFEDRDLFLVHHSRNLLTS
jgi:hypothetical protein